MYVNVTVSHQFYRFHNKPATKAFSAILDIMSLSNPLALKKYEHTLAGKEIINVLSFESAASQV